MDKKLEGDLAAFADMIEGRGIPAAHVPRLLLTAAIDPLRMILTHMPGPAGYGLRRLAFSRRLAGMGKNCLFDVGVRLSRPDRITIGEYTWIDAYACLNAVFGDIRVGKRCHIAPNSVLSAGPEGVEIQDYVAIGAGAQLYGHSAAPVDGKRMSGPMIPWKDKAFKTGRIVVERDAFIGPNCVVLPGVTIGQGAVVGAGSVISQFVQPWSIVMGNPARLVGRREPVSMTEF